MARTFPDQHYHCRYRVLRLLPVLLLLLLPRDGQIVAVGSFLDIPYIHRPQILARHLVAVGFERRKTPVQEAAMEKMVQVTMKSIVP